MTRGGIEPLRLYRPGERRQVGPRSFIIGGLLGCGEAMLLIGAPKSGKSAVAVAASACVAAGEAFFGQSCRAGAVIYVPAERFDETDVRLEMATRGQPDLPLRLVRVRLDEDVDRLAGAMLQLATDHNVSTGLFVFDTVNALLRDVAGDENSARDIGKLTLAIDRLRRMTGAAVMVIHHAKRGEKRSRGSDALEAWAETVAMVDCKGDTRRMAVVRSNVIEPGIKATFKLTPIDLGKDAETGCRSSVVLAQAIDAALPEQPFRLTRDAGTALAELKRLPVPVSVSDWRTAVMVLFGDRSPGARRQAFSKVKEMLTTHDVIIIDGETVSVSERHLSVSADA